MHKLEQNTEEIRDTVPNVATLNRQITDLSSAGANLFHAVVELQRLRASSERKFSRWFFETRADNERNREVQGQLENALKNERNAREEGSKQRADAFIQAENARREVAEMRRELMISKDEARRAWEELGRRNQESLETAQSLKDGRITLVGGVQVVPYFGGPSRTGSTSQRPGTREGMQQYGSTGMASAAGAAGLQSPGDEQMYYQQEASPTNTDPFTETAPVLQREGKTSLAAGTYQPAEYDTRGTPTRSYDVRGTPTTTSTQQTAIPLSGQRPAPASQGALGPTSRTPVTAAEAQRFYQQQETFLHSPQSSSQAIAASRPPATREEVLSQGSYIESVSEGGAEYQYDEQGQPIRNIHSNGEDDYDTEADIRREQELAAQYGGGGGMMPEAPSVPSTSAQAMATYSPSATSGAQPSRPDYEGAGYSQNWDTLQTRHHHPTRLSDVLEEEEERSSRRTGD